MFLAACILAKAFLVAGPKYIDSWPGEPGPEEATGKPLEFKYACRALTSGPVEPMVRLRAKDPGVAEGMDAGRSPRRDWRLAMSPRSSAILARSASGDESAAAGRRIGETVIVVVVPAAAVWVVVLVVALVEPPPPPPPPEEPPPPPPPPEEAQAEVSKVASVLLPAPPVGLDAQERKW